MCAQSGTHLDQANNAWPLNSALCVNRMKQKRKIEVNDHSYIWVLEGNEIYTENKWIIITLEGTSYSRLYVNPYAHEFEIKPSFIEKAIKYARKNGWQPEKNSGEMRLSFNNEDYEVIKSA